MKLKNIGRRLVKTARIINRFGNACLIRRANGRHELIGGTDSDVTAAREWASLFAHEVVFTRPSARGESSPHQKRGTGQVLQHILPKKITTCG